MPVYAKFQGCGIAVEKYHRLFIPCQRVVLHLVLMVTAKWFQLAGLWGFVYWRPMSQHKMGIISGATHMFPSNFQP